MVATRRSVWHSRTMLTPVVAMNFDLEAMADHAESAHSIADLQECGDSDLKCARAQCFPCVVADN